MHPSCSDHSTHNCHLCIMNETILQLSTQFAQEGARIIRREFSLTLTWNACFVAHFGITPTVCAHVWIRTCSKVESSAPKHLLFALIFLKLYNSDRVLAASCGVSENTFRKWAWAYIRAIAQVDVVYILKFLLSLRSNADKYQVRWENRIQG